MTSVVGVDVDRAARVAVPITAPSTSTSYSVPARNGKRGTKQTSSPSATRRPAVAGLDCMPRDDDGRTATRVAIAPPWTRRHGESSQVDHDTRVTTTSAALQEWA